MLRSVDRVLVVEEMSPFLEHALHSLSSRLGIRTPIFGKLTGHLPVPFEIEPPTLEAAVRTLLGFSPNPMCRLPTSCDLCRCPRRLFRRPTLFQ
jgi:TPP-dependent indolepyruvate ferredoxin oxidoreductase alpha subunit